jgi:predicted nucleic acid-binding protein
MADVVVDTNVIVGYLDRNDSLHVKATAVFDAIEESSDHPELLSFLVAEAVSVLARRSVERRTSPPVMGRILAVVRAWMERDELAFVEGDEKSLFTAAMAIVDESGGRLNFNDALLVVLQRQAVIGEIVTFDARLAEFPGIRCRLSS